MAESLTQGLGVAALAMALCLLSAIAVAGILARLRHSQRSLFERDSRGEARLLFDGDQLLDATASGRDLFARIAPGGRSDWQRFQAWVQSTFPEAQARLRGLQQSGIVTLGPQGEDGLCLRAEWRSGLQHITLSHQGRPDTPGTAADGLTAGLRDAELSRLRQMLQALPLPLWSEGTDGSVLQANPAYLALMHPQADPRSATSLPWPLPAVFPGDLASGARCSITDASGRQQTCRVYDLNTEATHRSRVALPLEDSEKSEATLNAFVRTLALTFAGLPIGLAVFDSQRRLRLFNPALTDMTGLPVEFLIAQPRLFSLLDELRTRQRIPEPRDYNAWRNRLTEIGTPGAPPFEEIWPLPDGQTFQVVGHGHAEGAITLLLQDISPEVTRSRRLRSDLALGQAVIEGVELPLAVFSPAGELVLCNPACEDLWQQDLSNRLTAPSFTRLCAEWRSHCVPSPVWQAAEEWMTGSGPRPEFFGPLSLTDGRALDMRLKVLPEDAVLLSFRQLSRSAAEAPPAPARRSLART